MVLVCTYSNPTLSWSRDPLAPLDKMASLDSLGFLALLVLLVHPAPLALEE